VDQAPLFAVGDTVRIATRLPIGHYRTPTYVRGKTGRIERVLGRFVNPEEEAFGRNEGGEVRLYRVRLKQRDLWPDYRGSDADELQIEVFEHWLERA
jgi:nitrile hydratase